MLNELMIFFSQGLVVSLLVIQSVNNNHGRTTLAAITSLMIGLTQIVMWKLMPNASWSEIAAFVIAGPAGNVLAQWVKRKDIDKIRRLS